MAKRYLLFVKEDAIRDMQVLSNYGEVVQHDYFSNELEQDWWDFYGSVLLKDIMVAPEDDFIKVVEEVARDYNVCETTIQFMEIAVNAELETFIDVKRRELAINRTQLYSIGVILGNSIYEEEEVLESVFYLIDSLGVEKDHPIILEAYMNCFPEKALTEEEARKEIHEKLQFE